MERHEATLSLQPARASRGLHQRLRELALLGSCLSLWGGCSAEVNQGTDVNPPSSGTGSVNGGSGGLGSTGAGGTGGRPAGATGGSGGSGPGLSTGGSAATGSTGGATVVSSCNPAVVTPVRSPLRRLTRFEFNNTVSSLFGDTTNPANILPAEELGNGFGNDADALSVSSLLAERYGTVAEGIAQRATATPAALGKLGACATSLTATSTAAVEEACARTIISTLTPRVYRRPALPAEIDDVFALYKTLRTGGTFASGIGGVIEALLQTPDFLYRVELGAPDKAVPSLLRPTGPEMAVRLSYLFWATTPDDTLAALGTSGALTTNDGVLTQAKKMLDDPRSHGTVGFFFDNLMPLSGLTDLERDKTLFPTFTAAIGALMRQETQRLLEYEIYEGSGTWPGILTAPYTFVNDSLAKFYGMTAVTGTALQKVPLDTTKRLGLLTQGSIMAGTTHSNLTNPVTRGSFIVQKLMCKPIPLPTGDILAKVKPPDPYSGKTARDRYTQHRADPVCMTCHQFMDPVGLALENYDAVGLYRTTENDVLIDASGSVPGTTGTTNGPVELVQKLATSEEANNCFAVHWQEFAYGKTLSLEDQCARDSVQSAFKKSGYNVKALLLALTQTDAFLYLPAK